MAMLICRSLVGDPYIVQDPGDAVASAAFLLSGLRVGGLKVRQGGD